MIFKKMIMKIIKGNKYSSESYISFLKKVGVKVGENCTIYAPTKTLIDLQNPFMLSIGDNVKITEGVKILTHDFSWSVTSNLDGIITGSVGKVEIGNNVFIGMNSIITRNVKIGDNVIIGAGSIVTKNCESGYVYAGTPAKKIMTINDYHKKRKENQIDDAYNIVKNYYERYGKYPEMDKLREFLFLFDVPLNNKVLEDLLKSSGHYKKCLEAYKNCNKKFKNYNEFLKYCEDRRSKQ